jgi:FHS family glucose/mannose:H+ symporter-like MFS transporter
MPDATAELEPLTKPAAPSLALMHAVFVLAGLGTMLLGPILPLLAAKWQLQDSQAGLLLLAQFIGATLGGSTLTPRLSRDLLLALSSGAIGFLAFALAPGLPLACLSLLVGGFGVGRIIASVNILAGARFSSNRAAALTRLNFTWSFGALLSPLLAAQLTPHIALKYLLATFALGFAACAVALSRQQRNTSQPEASHTVSLSEPSIAPGLFAYFAALLFLYGGLETCLSGWLTTYALRYGQSSLVLSQYTFVLLLCGLTAGRALASWLLLHIRDTTLQRIALLLSAALAAALASAHSAASIATSAVLLGIALAPIFPATFAIFLAHRPPARIAGMVLAASGLGAAALPWLMGVLSTRTHSLQLALILPVAAAVAMLALTTFRPRTQLTA